MLVDPTSSPAFLQALRHHMREKPQATFCRQIHKGREEVLTWSRLERDCARFAKVYAEAGLQPGDQVLIFLRHVPEMYGAFFGAMFAGVVPSFMPCLSPRQDPHIYWSAHQQLFAHIQPKALVGDDATFSEMSEGGLNLSATHCIRLADLVKNADLPTLSLSEEDICLLQHSSGTTGLKKGVALSYRAIAAQLASYTASLSFTQTDVVVSWLPLYHDMGLIACLLLPSWNGAEIVHLDPFEWVGRPDTLFEQLEARGGTFTWLPNFAFEHLAAVCARKADRYDLSRVRAFISCSEVCKASSFDRFAAAFATSGVRIEQLQTCYAMAETVFAVSQSPLDQPVRRLRVTLESLDQGQCPVETEDENGFADLLETGAPITGMTVTVHDTARRVVADGVVGEIALSGPFLFTEYNQDPQRTASALEDGRYYSRDLGFIRDGRLYVLGRLDDLIIVNGRNFYAHEVEAAINRIEGIKPGRAVAFAIDDARNGTQSLVIAAERQVGTGVSDADLKRAITITLQSIFSIAPSSIELLAEGRLIKTTSGKISRKENAKRYLLDRFADVEDAN